MSPAVVQNPLCLGENNPGPDQAKAITQRLPIPAVDLQTLAALIVEANQQGRARARNRHGIGDAQGIALTEYDAREPLGRRVRPQTVIGILLRGDQVILEEQLHKDSQIFRELRLALPTQRHPQQASRRHLLTVHLEAEQPDLALKVSV